MASVSDNFDRADGAIGAAWIVDGGGFSVAANKCESTTVTITNRARHATQMDTINHRAAAVVGGKGAQNSGSLTVRQLDVGSTLYDLLYFQESAANGIRLRRVVAGSVTTVATYASGAGAHALELRVSGTDPVQLVVVIDGVQHTFDDDNAARITEGKYVGIRATSNTGGRFEDFVAEDIRRQGIAHISMRLGVGI